MRSPQKVLGAGLVESVDSVTISWDRAVGAAPVPGCAGSNDAVGARIELDEVGVKGLSGPSMTMGVAIALALDLAASATRRTRALTGGGW